MGTGVLQVLGSNLADLGWGRTIPYLAMFLASNGGGWLGDYLIQARRFPVPSARKTVNSVGELQRLLLLINRYASAGSCETLFMLAA